MITYIQKISNESHREGATLEDKSNGTGTWAADEGNEIIQKAARDWSLSCMGKEPEEMQKEMRSPCEHLRRGWRGQKLTRQEVSI